MKLNKKELIIASIISGIVVIPLEIVIWYFPQLLSVFNITGAIQGDPSTNNINSDIGGIIILQVMTIVIFIGVWMSVVKIRSIK